jgi:hypothetical protein
LLLFLDPGSGMGKNQDPGSGIRDKHPGSATLVAPMEEGTIFCLCTVLLPLYCFTLCF